MPPSASTLTAPSTDSRRSERSSRETIASFVRTSVRRAHPMNVRKARELMMIGTRHVDWCVTAHGLELGDNLWDPFLADAFIRSWGAHRRPRTVAAGKSQLHDLIRHINAGEDRTALRPRSGHASRPTTPYTAKEIPKLYSWANTRRMRRTGRTANAIITLGLGFGLNASTMTKVRAHHFTDHGTQGIELSLPDRQSWCDQDFEGHPFLSAAEQPMTCSSNSPTGRPSPTSSGPQEKHRDPSMRSSQNSTGSARRGSCGAQATSHRSWPSWMPTASATPAPCNPSSRGSHIPLQTRSAPLSARKDNPDAATRQRTTEPIRRTRPRPHRHEDLVPDRRVKMIDRIITDANIPQTVDGWRADACKSNAGRTAELSLKAVIVVFLILAVEGSPLLITTGATLLHRRLSRSPAHASASTTTTPGRSGTTCCRKDSQDSSRSPTRSRRSTSGR